MLQVEFLFLFVPQLVVLSVDHRVIVYTKQDASVGTLFCMIVTYGSNQWQYRFADGGSGFVSESGFTSSDTRNAVPGEQPIEAANGDTKAGQAHQGR